MMGADVYDDHEYTWLDDKGNEWRDCWDCGGEGFHDGDCTCMDDCCCCLTPDPPTCRTCRGTGALMVKGAPDKDREALRQILAEALAKQKAAL